MSRLAKKPIMFAGAALRKEGDFLLVKGPKGEIKVRISPKVEIVIGESEANLKAKSDDAGADLGTAWALVKNAVEGVSRGFSKVLDIEGVGFRATLEGKELVLFLGYALPVRIAIPDGISVKLDKNSMEVSGTEKELVGRFAAQVRAEKKPEPYKGKGIRYRGEIVKRKVGKKAGATAAA